MRSFILLTLMGCQADQGLVAQDLVVDGDSDGADTGQSEVDPVDSGEPDGGSGTAGAWLLSNDGHCGDIDTLVLDQEARQAVVEDLVALGVQRAYAALGEVPVVNPEAARAWSGALDAVGIDSQLLLSSEQLATDPALLAGILTRIDERLLPLQRSAPPDQVFDALHLQLRPYADCRWARDSCTCEGVPTTCFTDAERMAEVEALGEVVAATRAHLDGEGQDALPLYIDLPAWLDQEGVLPWTSTSARDRWFRDLDGVVDGVSLLSFERDSAEGVEAAAATEQLLLAGELRLGLSAADIGRSIDSWSELEELRQALEGSGHSVDLHAYTWLVEAGVVDCP